MPVMSAIMAFSGEANSNTAALTAGSSTSEIVLGTNAVFVINADQDIAIKFGNSGMAAAAATDYRIPANQQTTLDTGTAYSSIRVWNLAASATAHVCVQKLSKF